MEAGMAVSKKIQMWPPFPDRDRSRTTGISIRRHVSSTATASSRHPVFFQINRQEVAGFIQQHRIHTSYEVAASCVRAYEMLVDHIYPLRVGIVDADNLRI